LPPEILFDRSIYPSADIWELGSMVSKVLFAQRNSLESTDIVRQLANLAAQTPEYDDIILGNGGDAISQISLSRTLLGELPPEYLSKIPDAKQQTGDFKVDALFLRIRDNPLASMAIDEYKFPNEELLQFVQLLKAMLVYSPAKRITARGALGHEFFAASSASDID
jgi:serine/threonine protein kinase